MDKAKLNSIVSLDTKKEKDLISFLEKCRDSRRLGDFVTICVRACWDNPKILEKSGYNINSNSLTAERIKYFKDIEDKLNNLVIKVNEIYDIAFKVYMLSLMGKKLGIEEQSLNTLKAQFILQKQLNEFRSILGIENLVYESDKIADIQSKADDILEYIINSYDGIVTELKEVKTIPIETIKIENNTIKKDNTTENIEITEQKDDDIQLGFDNNVDWDALSNFLGD